LGYEYETAMTGNPLIFRERRSAAGSSTFYVDAVLLLLFGPDSGSYGSKMGAAAATSRYAHSTTASTLPLILLRYLLYMGRSPLFLTRMEPPDAFYDCSNLIIVDGRLTPEAIPTQE
jgi:hypothetical protein